LIFTTPLLVNLFRLAKVVLVPLPIFRLTVRRRQLGAEVLKLLDFIDPEFRNNFEGSETTLLRLLIEPTAAASPMSFFSFKSFQDPMLSATRYELACIVDPEIIPDSKKHPNRPDMCLKMKGLV